MLGTAEKIWLGLVSLTLFAALLAETGQAGWPLSLAVAGTILVKSGLLIEHYMEMSTAKVSFRLALYVFVILVALLVLLTHGYSEEIKRLTSL